MRTAGDACSHPCRGMRAGAGAWVHAHCTCVRAPCVCMVRVHGACAWCAARGPDATHAQPARAAPQSTGIKIKYDCNEGTCKTCEAMVHALGLGLGLGLG